MSGRSAGDETSLREAYDAWLARLEDTARQPRRTQPGGLEVSALAVPTTGAGAYLERLGFPGAPPYTRGVYAAMYRSRLWTMRQYAGFGSATASNARYRYLLEQGQTGLSIAFDLPTQMGYDSDDPMATGEVGRVGVAIDSVEDMHALLAELPLEQVSTSMTINSTAALLLGMVLIVADERGVSATKLRGTIQNDLLKEYVARGTYIFPPLPSLRITTDIFEFCHRQAPEWNTISISGYHIREAGATAAQELGFTLANAITYVDAALGRGLPLAAFAPRLSFFFNAHNNFLEEVAKFRAARRLWARLMGERFGAMDPALQKLRFHAQTGGSTLTASQPLTNLARVTLQALAAVLGGTQSLHTNSFDEAISLPTEDAARLALRIQQIIAHESGVPDAIDPLGGAYTIEQLTDALEAEALDLIGAIDARGGVLAAIESGWIQEEIHRSAFRAQLALEKGEQRIVGVNCFTDEGAQPSASFALDPALEAEQRRRLAELRRARSTEGARRALDELRRAAESTQNLMPPVIEALRARATLGEISNVLRQVFGTYRESTFS